MVGFGDVAKPMNGKVVIVTGSTKGIGRGIAEVLAGMGCTVVVTSRNREAAVACAAEMSKEGGCVVGLPFNLEDRTTFEPLIEETLGKFGRIDGLVNNALSQVAVFPFDELPDDQVEFALTSNITNILLLCRKARRALADTHGCIVNIASVAANRHVYGMPMYSIAKGSLVQMTKVLAAEWARDKIRVNAVNPGFVYSSALEYFNVPQEVIAEYYKFAEQYHPLGRIGEPNDIGQLVAYLTSDLASFMTGAVINIDAGLSVQGIHTYQGE